MPFHIEIWPSTTEQQLTGELYAVNVDEETLRSRFLDPYDEGRAITWNGRTLSVGEISYIHVFESPGDLAIESRSGTLIHQAITRFPEVTNRFISGGPGHRTAQRSSGIPVNKDPRRVMIVHGRNLVARDAMATFLRALGLAPIEWEQAIAETRIGTPHNFDAVRAAMDVAQAVVVVLTAEDRAGIFPELSGDDPDDELLRGQPRQNVILEAGMAMGIDRQRTILVEVGGIRRASDFEGLNTIRLTNAARSRSALRGRLITAGCEVDETAQDYLDHGAGGDFEAAVLQWAARAVG